MRIGGPHESYAPETEPAGQLALLPYGWPQAYLYPYARRASWAVPPNPGLNTLDPGNPFIVGGGGGGSQYYLAAGQAAPPAGASSPWFNLLGGAVLGFLVGRATAKRR